MGNGFGKITDCLSRSTKSLRRRRRRHGDKMAAVVSDPYVFLDEGLGHSFCYVRPVEPSCLSSSKVHNHEDPPPPTAFRAISGASLSANTSTAPFSSSSPSLVLTSETAAAAAFDCSESFFSVPLQPVPRLLSVPLSGPLDRGFLSGPIERGFMSGPIDPHGVGIFSGPLAGDHHHLHLRRSFSTHGLGKARLVRGLRKAIARTIYRGHKVIFFSSKELESAAAAAENCAATTTTTSSSNSMKLSGCSFDGSSEEEQRSSLHWAQGKAGEDRVHVVVSEEHGWVFVGIYDGFNGPDATDYLLSNLYPAVSEELKGVPFGEEAVLGAMREALRKTEEGFLGIADNVVVENPELALMGSCVLAMVMKGEDVYLMNVGDSRAVVARGEEEEEEEEEHKSEDLEKISEERSHGKGSLEALQLTVEHGTCVEQEVRRIRREHPDDAAAIVNNRVKGSLKVTRAFGAGFLKKSKWNDALLETFRVDYVGTSPYITCNPSLSHHRLSQRDRFLILSSDGLYQYFTNEEAVAEIESFMVACAEGDPAQHLIEEVLFRAAKKAGLDFHELLEIPQGDRRRYHDDVCVIVISFEGRIWRSSM